MPTYVQGIDFISDTDECRRLARQVVPVDFSDPQIQAWQFYNYSTIRTLTHKDNWQSTDREFGALKGLETKMTAADILEHYGDMTYSDTWDKWRTAAINALTMIADNLSPSSDDSLDEGRFIITSSYESYPNSLNDDENAQPYRSTSTFI